MLLMKLMKNSEKEAAKQDAADTHRKNAEEAVRDLFGKGAKG